MASDTLPTPIPSAGGATGAGSATGAGPHPHAWRTARGALPLDRPRVMGILNVTPDSFWDGGRHAALDEAVLRAGALLAEGADILDVGGESTRPGARSIPAGEEVERVVPVIAAIAREWPEALISVDTVKAPVAAAALDAGAAIVNDVSALRLDPEMGAVCAEAGAGVVLMHSRGTVDRMASYETAVYRGDVVEEVVTELTEAASRAVKARVAEEAIVLDPGLGFSKRTADSVAALGGLERLLRVGYPVLLGPSRKRFIGDLAGGLPAEERLPGTIAACVAGWLAGATLFRVHDVAPVRQALAVAAALGEPGTGGSVRTGGTGGVAAEKGASS